MHQAHTQGAHTGYSNEKMVPNDQKLDEIRLSHVQSHTEKYEIDEGVGTSGHKRGGGAHLPSPPCRGRDNHISSSFRPFWTIFSLEYPVWAPCGPQAAYCGLNVGF